MRKNKDWDHVTGERLPSQPFPNIHGNGSRKRAAHGQRTKVLVAVSLPHRHSRPVSSIFSPTPAWKHVPIPRYTPRVRGALNIVGRSVTARRSSLRTGLSHSSVTRHTRRLQHTEKPTPALSPQHLIFSMPVTMQCPCFKRIMT